MTARATRLRGRHAARLCGRFLSLVMFAAAPAIAQDMPDPSLIHGKALPATELPDGTVTVRVVREAIGNNVAGQPVTVTAGGRSYSATTDELGRAEFTSLPGGAEGRAETTVDGEALTSEPFGVPRKGGLRVILVSGIARAAARKQQEGAQALAAAPVQGVVVLGGDTRVVAQFQSDMLRFYYRLDILNTARTRVDTGGPLIIDLPKGAAGASLQGTPAGATMNGTRLTVVGPFNPGTTSVELTFQLPHFSPDLTVSQRWPVPVQQWLVGVQKVGGLSVSSPQFEGTEERNVEGGSTFVLGSGAPLAAGSTLVLQFSNLPYESRVASRIAVGLALVLLAGGVWLSIDARAGRDGLRQALIKRRDTLLAKLTDLEASRRAGSIPDDRYLTRRQRLMGDLEQIYSELDDAGDGSGGGGEGVAA